MQFMQVHSISKGLGSLQLSCMGSYLAHTLFQDTVWI